MGDDMHEASQQQAMHAFAQRAGAFAVDDAHRMHAARLAFGEVVGQQ